LGGSRGGTLDQNWAPIPTASNPTYFDQRQQAVFEKRTLLQPEPKQVAADFKRTVGEGRRPQKQTAGEIKQASGEQKAITGVMTGVFNGNPPYQIVTGHDKRFKSLPPTEMLSRYETLGGYIFVCNNDTMQEDLKRQLFGELMSAISSN